MTTGYVSETNLSTAGQRDRSDPLKIKQLLLPLKSPTIPCEPAVSANGPMTRNSHRDRVRGAGSTHRAGRRRPPDRLRDLTIGTSVSAGNLLKRFPDLALKGRGVHVQ